jgi:hypothetical protein
MNVFVFYSHIHIHNLEEAVSRFLSASPNATSTRYLLLGKSTKFYLNVSKTEITMAISVILKATCEAVSVVNR